MKRQTHWLLLSCVLLALAAVLFGILRAAYAAPMPEASARGGYYESSFTLELTAPKNGRIHYTLDGSTPTAQSQVYRDGIEIRDRSPEPNHYNSIQNVVPDWKNYAPGTEPVPKGTVVRAVFINDKGIQSEVFTQTYFVGVQPPERGYTLSLVFEEDDLFGENGIYVTGRAYDQWYLTGGEPEAAPQPNFMEHRETTAIAELMDADGDVMNQRVGVRTQGHSARTAPKKRLILASRQEYSGNQSFETELYPGVTTHSVMLKSDWPDAMAADFVLDRAVAVQRSKPIRLYLNGEYWMDTYMLERYDKQYFRQYYKTDDRMLTKNGETDEESRKANALDYYAEYMDWAEHTDFSEPDAWKQMKKTIDVQSYIDFIAINYYLCNYDVSPYQNYVNWRGPGYLDPDKADTRWRWCLYDMDAISTVEYALPQMTYPAGVANPAGINTFVSVFPQTVVQLRESIPFRSLRANPEFNRQFVLSFMDIGNNNFSPANVQRILTKYGMDPSWQDGYFLKRPAYAAQHLAEEFGLTGTLETVTVTTADPQMGSVKVNTSVIDLSDRSWSGQYFTDYPITLTAQAAEGYRFVGWKGGSAETDNSITVPVDGGIALEAVFAEK